MSWNPCSPWNPCTLSKIPVILEILSEISNKIRRKISEIRREIPGIWPKNHEIQSGIPKILPEIYETRLEISEIHEIRSGCLEIQPNP